MFLWLVTFTRCMFIKYKEIFCLKHEDKRLTYPARHQSPNPIPLNGSKARAKCREGYSSHADFRARQKPLQAEWDI